MYGDLLGQVREPVILHWLGEAFDPQLRGYWGTRDTDVATETFLETGPRARRKVDGVKVSLLSADHETGLRAALPDGVRLYTGDDFNYPELIRGDGHAPLRRAARRVRGDHPGRLRRAGRPRRGRPRDVRRRDGADAAAVAARLRGARPGTTRPASPSWPGSAATSPASPWSAGMQSARSVVHLGRLFVLADDARLLPDPELAAHRLRDSGSRRRG